MKILGIEKELTWEIYFKEMFNHEQAGCRSNLPSDRWDCSSDDVL